MFDFFLATTPILFILSVNLIIKITPWIKDEFDIITGGTYSDLHDTYSLIYAHMNENPDQWKFNKDYARFPKSGGAAIVSITKENDNRKLQISIDQINNGQHAPMNGYFHKIFRDKINKSFEEQSTLKMANVLFPNENVIMLTDESKREINNDFLNSLKKDRKVVSSYD